MNLQRREEIRELIAEITRYEELGATLDLESKAHDAITELLAHIDTLEQTAAERVIADGKAPAVVVPELTEETLSLACGCAIEPSMGQDAIKYGLRTARRYGYRAGWNGLASRLRAIPADRVMGEGVVALRRFAERCAQRDHQPDEHIGSAKCVACEAEDALRASQGGEDARKTN